MYERFYRLRERPFALTPDPDYLYPSRVHKEALSYLRYGIESHAGFVVITGAIGSGKTTLLQTMLRGLDGQTTVARVMNTLLDPRELLESAMIDVGLDPAGKSKPAMLKAFGEFLVNERSAGRLVLLVIDEAQNLTLPALEEIRMLSNLETEKSKLIQIVLVGQPNLHDLLNQPQLEQLRQRVTVRYHLRPLDPSETASYINHRLRKAAIGTPLVFPPEATDLIGRASGGLPRKINVIADAVLLFGYGEDKHAVDAALVREVIAELETTGVLGTATAGDGEEEIPDSREADLRRREQQVAEQHRIVTEQYRLLRLRESQLAAAALSDRAVAHARRPIDTDPMEAPRPDAGNSGLWARLRQGLFAAGHAPVVQRHHSTMSYFDKDAHS
jgi:putative secretion ATPase (PEP-CTERM system associated)